MMGEVSHLKTKNSLSIRHMNEVSNKVEKPRRIAKRKARTLEGIMNVPPSLRLTEDELKLRLAGVESMSGSELRREYQRVWGMRSYSNNYAVLRGRISWRLYTFCYGSLNNAVLAKARALADASQMRERAPIVRRTRPVTARPATPCKMETDDTLSAPDALPQPTEWMSTVGHVLVKQFRGTRYAIHALPQGRCHCNGTTFPSLSAAARAIAGYKCSGNVFIRGAEQHEHL